MKSLLLNLILLATIVFVALTSSCTSTYYMPGVQNVPLHTEKDQVTLTANAGTTFEVESFDFQGSYSFEDNFAFMLNGQFARGGRANSEDDNSGNGNLLEAAVGYYKPLSEKVVFETYLGGGSGNVINRYGNGARSKVGLSKIFLQPQIGFKSKYVDLAFSYRLNWLGFRNTDLIGVLPENEIDDFNTINDFGRRLLIEPALTARIGNDPIKLQAQITSSRFVRDVSLNRQYVLFSLGVHATF
ncbi:MAG: hypothetical protein AAFQ94_01765 [Bacteroidota bacterium]